ncbi:phage integrase SAM-like domain-containing protein [Chryseobacterium indoltheticum]|uniref:phage integrase SAM-like domain-containing protein n=1 Tax=Chryseobacterium indoltheticum TaxID=254 RepID=UPI003F499377
MTKNQYAQGTYNRYAIALSHVDDFIKQKYKFADLEFRDLNYEFIKDYEYT